MNQNGLKGLQFNLSGVGCWLTLILGAWLVGAVGLGWLIKPALVITALVILTLVLAFVGFRFWLKRNLIEGNCPVCSQPLTGIAPFKVPCPSCGTAVQATRKGFQRVSADGTIDVQAVDVQAVDIGDPGRVNLAQEDTATNSVIDVDVKALPDAD